ncbi:MAG: FHA domain-containing protein [Pirellulaceae bacterium]|nr:FHA domain-containing protein [Pirellulaceae bacterium]
MAALGELVPVGGGDRIPLLKDKLVVGRRESCDIVLRFDNVSALHCQLTIESGYWFVKDLNSRNGTKVNGKRVIRKRIDPGDTISIAKHKYEVEYSPIDLGATGPPPADEEALSEIMGKSLLDRAGLERRYDSKKRYDVLNNEAGQIRDPNKPV